MKNKFFNLKAQFDNLIEAIIVEPENISNSEKKRISQNITDIASNINVGISLHPLINPDIIFIAPIQVSLVLKIANIYGHNLDKKTVEVIIDTLIKSAFSETIIKSVGFMFPFLKAPIYTFSNYVITQAIGKSSIRFFSDKGIQAEYSNDYIKREFKKVNYFFSEDLKSSFKDRLSELTKETKNTLLFIPSEN